MVYCVPGVRDRGPFGPRGGSVHPLVSACQGVWSRVLVQCSFEVHGFRPEASEGSDSRLQHWQERGLEGSDFSDQN